MDSWPWAGSSIPTMPSEPMSPEEEARGVPPVCGCTAGWAWKLLEKRLVETCPSATFEMTGNSGWESLELGLSFSRFETWIWQ